MRFLPLGDQAVLAYCSDEAQAAAYAARVRKTAKPWVVDVVQAYRSVAVFYDLASADYWQAEEILKQLEHAPATELPDPRLFTIPCCYNLGLDWPRLEVHTRLSRREIIALHAGSVFTVFAIGFCPGFPYMGYLPEPIARVPRLASPRLKVAAGSVGLTGKQTGIYTEERPGGWNIIGQTPLELVNVKDSYFPLRTGDQVQFEPISEIMFKRLAGNRLS